MVKNQFSIKIQCYQTDQGGEFKSIEMDKILAKEGIIWKLTVPYIYKQNRTAEWGNQTIQEKARSSLIDVGLPSILWAEALNMVVYLANRLSMSQIITTLYKALHERYQIFLTFEYLAVRHMHLMSMQRTRAKWLRSHGKKYI